jgi:hypothetical protein
MMDICVRTADACADGNEWLLRIGAPLSMETLAEHAALGRNLCGLLAVRLRRTFDLFRDAKFESLEVRLDRQVLYLARRDEQRSEQGFGWRGGSARVTWPTCWGDDAQYHHDPECLEGCRRWSPMMETARG